MALASIQEIKITPSNTPHQTAPDRARLSLDPATLRHAGINGAWWPRSRDAAAELPSLLTELSTPAGRVRRIALQVDAFDNIPHQLSVGGHKVHVAWFKHRKPPHCHTDNGRPRRPHPAGRTTRG
jgi:hypothetical protein